NRAAPPLIDHLEFLLGGYLAGDPALGARARRFLGQAEKFLRAEKVDPCVVQVAALLLAALTEKKAHSLDDFPVFRTMLDRVGLASAVAERTCELVRMVQSGVRDQSPECRILMELLKSEEGSGPR
ncbi:MAG TPA: hypothetical protein VN648_00105, partial [Candidatus Methylomirabilis sp.]|nr:hypothetical protein [Candidatus Methylomirabilis sp.]